MWEYKITEASLDANHIIMNLGKEGWELVTVLPNSGNMYGRFYFKRKINQEEIKT